ncbi:oligopeptide/dipeptide ABC transporter, ATPase subunit [Desulfovibrio sp. X2]|uniref:ABC transporter ATP-binding protein n=1 Tax=Desulfovibrio sp. X2 TaxID=941449 RepID=UPI000358AFAF|nr:ABC transporter ATP-binding protein [Desulfovibrio sp. X2]EPR44742.1 oligopeptide/dipeptide ABC transporter, ATPase subunit [Desulfovibrio sp. X2]
MNARAPAAPVLSVKDLVTVFDLPRGDGASGTFPAPAVDGASLDLAPGETVALVGESGSGKTMVALSVLGLVPPPGRVASGSILFSGRELAGLSAQEYQGLRGRHLAMIFQEPMTALNPVFTVGEQIAEPLRLHLGLSPRDAAARAVELLAEVGIPNPARRAKSYPHELSGGMRQRVVIAMALSCGPEVVLADEPTTALDVTIQAEILDLMAKLREERGMAVLLITHDLGVVAGTAGRVAVMYAGRVVERAGVDDLFREPLHPYTQGLLASLPSLEDPGARLTPIAGSVPDISALPTGCTFHPRCPRAFARCPAEIPPDFTPRGGSGRSVRCWLYA